MSTTRRPDLTRRSFLAASGAGLGALAVSELLLGCGPGAGLGSTEEEVQIDVSNLPINEWISVRRPDDLLVVDFGLVNLKRVDTADGVALVKRKVNKPALIVAALPSQHLAEATSPSPPPILPVEHLRADGSRLVFNVGALLPVRLSLVGLLEACTRAGLHVARGAAAPAGTPDDGGSTSGADGPRAPHALETSLELPARLALSPNETARFVHARTPAASPRGRIELWSTRLVAPPGLRTMRALHHFAGPSVTGEVPNVAARDAIVLASGNRANPPIQVDRVALSALGAWCEASLDGLNLGGLVHWDQRVAMGRDTRVEVVGDGRLWPLPHRAVAVESVDRRWTDGPNPVAYLHRSLTILCTEPVRRYHPLPGMPGLEREWPFSSVRIVTRATPPIDGAPPTTDSIAPVVGGEAFHWQIEATDRRGETVRFSVPLVWMPLGQDTPSPAVTLDPVSLGGQRVAFAEPEAGELGRRDATTYETRSLTLGAEALMPTPAWDAPCYPRVVQADIVVEALAAVTGATGSVAVGFADAYLTHGLGRPAGNKHDLVLDLLGGPIRADFVKAGTDKVGGFLAPNLEVAGLSRLTGPVTEAMVNSPAADLVRDAVFPLPLGGALDAFCPRLFGCVSLLDLLDDTVGLDPEDLVPAFATEAFDEIQRLYQTVDTLLARKDELLLQLSDAKRAIVDTAAEAYQHALAIEAFFVDAPQLLLERARQAKAALVVFVESFDPLTVTQAQVDEAVRVVNVGLLGKIQDLGRELAKDQTARLIEYVPGGGTLLRTLRRLLTTAADVADTVATVVARLQEVLAALIRARDIVKDKSVKIDWRPRLEPRVVLPGITLAFRDTRGLLLSVELRAQQRGDQKAGADILCSLADFDLELLSILRLHFKRLQFRQRMSQKPEIDVVFDDIEFIGALSFVQTLQEILPTDGFSDPPAVKVDRNGLDASYSLDLPNLAIGVFSLEQMRIAARLRVPFLGDAISFRFEFSRREAPFLVTVAMLGGGGFFELELTPKGMRSLVASIQFGAQLSASIGVASGSISFMGGFVYEMTPTSVALTGFLRMRGECDILGLVSASIELYLDLKYDGRHLTGTATLSIEISVSFFTIPITLTTTRTFAGANGDPPFAAVVTEDDFTEYCLAFAA